MANFTVNDNAKVLRLLNVAIDVHRCFMISLQMKTHGDEQKHVMRHFLFNVWNDNKIDDDKTKWKVKCDIL